MDSQLDRDSPSRCKRICGSFVLLDIACLLIAALPFLALELNIVSPIHRGFYCGDQTISYPVTSDTISDGALSAGGVLITVVSVVLVECIRGRSQLRRDPLRGGNLVPNLYRLVGSFLLGAAASLSLTALAKTWTGRLRPHFLSVCRPDPALTDCSQGFITEDVCTGNPKLVTEARKSFFSGHASFAMYSMVFLVLYVEARLRWQGARSLRPLLQAVALLLAMFVGLSRVSDYKHHVGDVAAGFLQGGLVAVFVVFHISGLFPREVRLEWSRVPSPTSNPSPPSAGTPSIGGSGSGSGGGGEDHLNGNGKLAGDLALTGRLIMA
ncbi:phospholipid phosphatase 3-like [Lethenteron reissneri]|uniref:phospholipid phosphatase 3-like n=1 Tax=Lethenteron reissneri TaxID=7753 RepID=UPI002AB77937|nr:phospholipid phosphatase 3-like [Lethenteron reissneri]